MSSATNTDTKNDFSKGSVIKNILNLALPMTLAQLWTGSTSAVSRKMPPWPSPALASVSLSSPWS